MADFTEYVRRFTDFPGAVCGHGPNHPSNPNGPLSADLDSFRAEYSHLIRYPDFLRFLDLYAGIAIASDERNSPYLAMFGLGEFFDEFSASVTPDHFHVFAESYSTAPSGKTVYYAFAFNVTPDRRDGVYRALVDPDSDRQNYHFLAETFTEWLAQTVSRGGVFLELDPDGKPI